MGALVAGRGSGDCAVRLRRAWDILRLRLRSLARPGRVERELEKELRFHLDRQVEENLGVGMPLADASWAA